MTGANPDYVTTGVFADDDTITSYHVRYYLSAGTWYLEEGYYSGGVLTVNTVALPYAPYLPSTTGVFYLGAYNATTNFWNGSIFRFYLKALSGSSAYGGTFHFDEAYAGTRTPFVAENVTAMATEMSIPSVQGGLVEPAYDVTGVTGSSLTFPSWYPPAEVDYWTGVQANGYAIGDLHGPYGSNFTRSPLQQLLGLSAICTALQNAGIQGNLVTAEWDVRSPQAFAAVSNGAYYYLDGPLYPYTKTLNGKLAL